MFKPRTPEDQLLLSTVRIETDRGNATGFFFGVKGKGDCLITSRHAVQDASSGLLRLHNAFWRDECHAPPTFDIELDNFAEPWIKHPDDSIDLLALPSYIIDDAASQMGHSAHWMTVESIMIPSPTRLTELEAVEDVLMVGYLNGLWALRSRFRSSAYSQ